MTAVTDPPAIAAPAALTASMDRVVNQRPPPVLQVTIKDLACCNGNKKKHSLSLYSWSTIQNVKHRIRNLTAVPVGQQRLFLGPNELPNHRRLQDAGIDRSGATLLLDYRSTTDPQGSCGPHLSTPTASPSSSSWELSLAPTVSTPPPSVLQRAMTSARRGMAVGIKPTFALDGTGGTYFLSSARRQRIAVFKPADEEPYAIHNPRGYLPLDEHDSSSMRAGIQPGESCLREVAAYLLDHDGFCHVPATTLVQAKHEAFHSTGNRLTTAQGGAMLGPHSLSGDASTSSTSENAAPLKLGSLQLYVDSEGSMDDLSPSLLSAEQVHRIAVLDMRLLNADRNAANLLVVRNSSNQRCLVPIDHGYCLRRVSDVSWMDWCWLDWPQLKQPVSNAVRDFIEKIDIASDVQLLRELGLPTAAIEYFIASNMLLKAGLAADLTLYEMATLMCRTDNAAAIPSVMEELRGQAAELSTAALRNEQPAMAQQAIVHQLTPRRRKGDNRLPKSISLMGGMHQLQATRLDFTSFENEFKNDVVDDTMPGMTQSAESDSASADELCDDDDTCDVWAAGLVDSTIVSLTRPERSPSIESDVSSSDDDGFWHVRPGGDMDDSIVSWNPTPVTSPVATSREILEPLNAMEALSLAPPDVAVSASMPTTPTPTARKGVSFQLLTPKMSLPPPPATVHVFRSMARSKSHSALHNNNHTNNGHKLLGVANATMTAAAADYHATPGAYYSSEEYQEYWTQFMELIIQRHVLSTRNNRVMVAKS